MIHGFTFSADELEEWGKQIFGDTDDEEIWRATSADLWGPCTHVAVTCGEGRPSASLLTRADPAAMSRINA